MSEATTHVRQITSGQVEVVFNHKPSTPEGPLYTPRRAPRPVAMSDIRL